MGYREVSLKLSLQCNLGEFILGPGSSAIFFDTKLGQWPLTDAKSISSFEDASPKPIPSGFGFFVFWIRSPKSRLLSRA